MGFFKNLFTWWDGATTGTAIYSWRNGREVGRDEAGNIYFEGRKGGRRWVMYAGANEGMLFPFDPPRPASFWMRNTLIPLDLIFIRPDGTIARIATGVPRSERQIEVDEPVTAVLEIPGGRAAALGIAAGDRISWTD